MLFPEAYLAHVERMIGPEALAVALGDEVPEPEPLVEEPEPVSAEPAHASLADEGGEAGGRWLWFASALALAAGLACRRRLTG